MKIKEIENQNQTLLKGTDLSVEDLKKMVEDQRKKTETKFRENEELEKQIGVL